ncbi:hypothetical protein M2132_000010 [Dysgonomonas sp. PH5-45]|uniref:hypothetical protein n=1 Tax=unclassified Dysgonomonas TaxID=2630389 RepID=UPI0024739C50|nr:MULTISPECIES: hypothetical protein [unclassified Dysgonomonas]MDH6353693.1 hypothetical protein [Dysgonomonas sp. PH5-45]MDH6386596.1 hypothetical protein [Dysgonomonas sp. PH5-37]
MVNEQDKKINTSSTKDKNIGDLRKILFKQLNTIKKISLLENYLNDYDKKDGKSILRKVNEIIYDSAEEFDWELFFQTVNALYDDFLIRLTNLHPQLDKRDILICCLTKLEFNNTEIALLIKSNQNIIQKRKTVIRELTGMKKQESFAKQLDIITLV